MAVSAIAAPISRAAGGRVKQALLPAGERFAEVGGSVAGTFGAGAVRQLVYGGKADFTSIAADAFGNALGDAIVDTHSGRGKSQQLGALSRAQEEVGGATGLWPDVEPGVGLRATDAARRAFDEGVAQEIYVQRRVREADDIAARLYPAVADDDPFLGMDSMAATRGVAFNEVPVSQARQNEVRAGARSRADAQASSDWNRARERTGANPDVTGTGLLTAARDSMSNYWSSFADEGQRERNFLKHATGRGMQALGTLAYGLAEVAVAASNSPMQATVGGFKSIGNFGPDLFNLAANGLKTSLDGLSLLAELGAGEGALEGFRASKAYNLNPLFGYENQAQAGGAVFTQLAVGTGLAKYGKYNIEPNLSSAGTLHSNPIPLKLTAPEPQLGVGSTVAAKG